MIVKLLGLLDILCSIVLFFPGFIPSQIIMTLAMFLFCKGMIFGMSYGSLASMIDAFGAIYIGLIVYGFNIKIISMILAFHLLIKGLLSLIAR
jgi:hypothetical protein